MTGQAFDLTVLEYHATFCWLPLLLSVPRTWMKEEERACSHTKKVSGAHSWGFPVDSKEWWSLWC
jgi:hypothetical protein